MMYQYRYDYVSYQPPYTVDQSLGKLYKILARILNEMSVCVLNGVLKMFL